MESYGMTWLGAGKGVPILGQLAGFLTIFVTKTRICPLPEHRKEDSPQRTPRPQRKLATDRKGLSHHRGEEVTEKAHYLDRIDPSELLAACTFHGAPRIDGTGECSPKTRTRRLKPSTQATLFFRFPPSLCIVLPQ